MPRTLTQYRVFIGSPGGLEEERRGFRDRLEKFCRLHAEHAGVVFHPVGWEDTLSGVGRPQALINEDLKQCDYAVFVLHDRWGSPTGAGFTSGTEEEWKLAEELYADAKVRNIALFFKSVDPGKMRDPGPQLQKVLLFKARIERERRYLFKQYSDVAVFGDTLEGHLAKWLRDHAGATGGSTATTLSLGSVSAPSATGGSPRAAPPSFDYWIAEAGRLLDLEPPDPTAGLFCATKAMEMAQPGNEWARARNTAGVAESRLGRLDEALQAFTDIVDSLGTAPEAPLRERVARALFNKGVTLGALGRSEDAIAAYDEVIARFGTAAEAPLREQVANALVNKGFTLGALGRSEDEIAAYDEVIARFGTAAEAPLREDVARALVNKGVTLGRSEDAIAAYDEVIARFGTAAEAPLREQVARALFNKGVTLGALGRSEDAIAAYDEVIARFGTAAEAPLREQVANALFNKGVRLGALGRSEDEIAAYDEVIARFGTAAEAPLREDVARALVNKGVTLGRSEDAIAAYDEVIARFGTAAEAPLREQVARALFNKGVRLGALGRSEDEIAAYDEVIARFGTAAEAPLREEVARARTAKANAQKPRKPDGRKMKR